MTVPTQTSRPALGTYTVRRWIEEVGAYRYVEVPRCDDAEVMRVWRECGLPEYFLGNGGTNNKLVEFARRLREPVPVERPPFDFSERNADAE